MILASLMMMVDSGDVSREGRGSNSRRGSSRNPNHGAHLTSKPPQSYDGQTNKPDFKAPSVL